MNIEERKSNLIYKLKEKYPHFNYDLSDFKNYFSKIKIVCPEHGDFRATPNNFLKSKVGCPECAKKSRVKTRTNDTTEFIDRLRLVHGNKYDYSNVKYVNPKTPIDIICKTHGLFSQLPFNHLSGKGCSKCKYENLSSKFTGNINDYLNRLEVIHPNLDFITEVNKSYSYDTDLLCVCKDHGQFYKKIDYLLRGLGCPQCKSSSCEKIIFNFLDRLNIKYTTYRVDVISKELDIYIPEKRVAIEINGNYWHSELMGKDRLYHIQKTEECLKKGIRLIHIFEHEIVNKPLIVFSRLKSILGFGKRRVYARKCEVKEITNLVSSKFLQKYHTQGKDSSSIRLGLFCRNKLISVMSFGKRRVALGCKNVGSNEYELLRYSGNFNFTVIGGASKLLKYFERKYKPKKIITYADRRWSEGGLYEILGFKFSHFSKPNYWYFHKNDSLKIYHRFNFRKSELDKKLENFNSDLTEWENMLKNGWNRIWDCGNYVYVKE